MEKIYKKIYLAFCRFDDWFLDLIYPPRCPICDKVVLRGEGICGACQKKLPWVKEPVCMRCGKPLSDERREYCHDCIKKQRSFAQGKALWVYEKEVKDSIYRFKYQNKREYAKTYALLIADRYGDWIKSRDVKAILPIPLHKKRQRRRGYNQAKLLAAELGKILGLPVYDKLLIRVHDTKPQKTLTDTERKNNLKKAFKTSENIVQLDCVLVVDDIYTTGATLDAAAAVLKEAGVQKVYACSVSIGRDD